MRSFARIDWRNEVIAITEEVAGRGEGTYGGRSTCPVRSRYIGAMEILRTPDERFEGLPGWRYAPRYVEVDGLRIHYVDEGPRDAPAVLMLHGEPSWAYLYRKVIDVVVAAGLRAVAPDLVGFGRSDKPARREDYTYARHLAWMTGFLAAVDLADVTLLAQDWGGLIGLRLLTAEPERFARVVVANTFLPTGDQPAGPSFLRWREFSQQTPVFDVGQIVAKGCARPPAPEVIAAYDAPFPDERYKAGARQFPLLVPISPDDPEASANREAWKVLSSYTRPFLTIWGDVEKVTRGGDAAFQAMVPGARGQPHRTLERAMHFLQEDAGEELGRAVAAFVRP
jgi:haloalkane dehalogenase